MTMIKGMGVSWENEVSIREWGMASGLRIFHAWGDSRMFPTEILLPYLTATLLIVLAPGPDNILAISRGLSQGRVAAVLSSVGVGLGIMVHSLAATLGLTWMIQSSLTAFWAVKIIGAVYLLWLGWRALSTRGLISFTPADRSPLWQVFTTGLLSNVLNPKPGLFVAAFIPQFISPVRGAVHTQMLFYGAIFAALTTLLFSLLGCFASALSRWLSGRPRVVRGVNIGAGFTFIGAGLSILMLKRRVD